MDHDTSPTLKGGERSTLPSEPVQRNHVYIPQPWPVDGWKISTPESQSINKTLLDNLQRHLAKKEGRVRSFLIIRNGSIVFEYYRYGLTENSFHSVASVTKSVVAALVGVALQRGYLRDLGQSIADYLPEVLAPQVDPRARDITLRDLLTMTAGFTWDQRSADAAPEEQGLPKILEGDLVNQVLSRPVGHKPGEVFNYDNCVPHLLSIILARASRMKPAILAGRFLFSVLGISKYFWFADAQGYNWGSHGLQLRSRDMAKLGYLFLRRGLWNGQPILPSSFVDAAATKQIGGGWPMYADYGYLWWIPKSGEPNGGFYANGFGGQYVYVVPESDLVIVMTSNVDAPVVRIQPFLNEYVMPALV